MKVNKVIASLLTAIMLCGCATDSTKDNKTEESINQTATELYKSLDAKETYQKAVSYSNEKIHFMITKAETDNDGKVIQRQVSETYNMDGVYSDVYAIYDYRIQSVSFWLEAEDESLLISGQKDTAENQLNMHIEDRTEISKKRLLFPDFYNHATLKVDKIEKKEVKNEIIITAFASSINDEVYCTYEWYINTDGFIEKEIRSGYTDKNREKLEWIAEYKFQDFNLKDTFDYKKELNQLQSLNGKSINEGIDYFNDWYNGIK